MPAHPVTRSLKRLGGVFKSADGAKRLCECCAFKARYPRRLIGESSDCRVSLAGLGLSVLRYVNRVRSTPSSDRLQSATERRFRSLHFQYMHIF